ncbi:MAG: QcrA and Rieske domain-containing protein [Planctomycetota bacterium]|jgi:cytochrome b6-f complex iron-sulfur subunit
MKNEPEREELDRRRLMARLGVGFASAAIGLPVVMSVRSLIPNALYEMPLKVKVGDPEQFADGPTFLKDQRVFVFREAKTFHCPCHGSRYKSDGTNYSGPAPRPLDYFKLERAPDDGRLVVDLSQTTDKGWRLTL